MSNSTYEAGGSMSGTYLPEGDGSAIDEAYEAEIYGEIKSLLAEGDTDSAILKFADDPIMGEILRPLLDEETI